MKEIKRVINENKKTVRELLQELRNNYLKKEKEICKEIDEVNFLSLRQFKTYHELINLTIDLAQLEKQLKEVKEAYSNLYEYMDKLKYWGSKTTIEEDIEKIQTYLLKLEFKQKLEDKYPEIKNSPHLKKTKI